AIVARHALQEGPFGDILLLSYWALRLPALGQDIANAARRLPAAKNVALRLIEPLGAAEERVDDATDPKVAPGPGAPPRGAAVRLEGVAVRAGGHLLLEDIELEARPA